MEKNHYPFFAAILTILASITAIIFFWLYYRNPIVYFAKGPMAVIFMLGVGGIGVLIAMISAYVWIRKSKGKIWAKKYFYALLILFVIGGAYETYAVIQQNKLYYHIDVNGVSRQYLIYVPTTYSSSTPMPLLLALHGGSGNAYQFEGETGFNAIAEKEGFIVVYPDGLGVLPSNILKNDFHEWNSGTIQDALQKGYDDVDFIVQLISYLEANYAINTSRIYMTGHSNGAMMTYRMAGEDSQIFAAIASVAGTIGGKVTPNSTLYTIPTPSSAVAVIEFHGLLDQNVKYEGGYPTSGFEVGVRWDLSVNDTINFWVSHDGCQSTPTEANSSNNLITVDKYINGLNNTQVSLVTFNTEDHFWENMNQATESEYGISLAQTIWNYLSKYSKT